MPTGSARNAMLVMLVSAATLLVGGIGFELWHQQYLEQQGLLLRPYLDAFETRYGDTLETFRLAATAEMRTRIDQPEILALIAHAMNSDTTETSNLQDQLRSALAQTYQRIRDWGGDRLQINLADGRVLLSIPQPAVSKDLHAVDPTSLRPAQVEKHAVNGLEEGPHGLSYRCVFPLSRNGRFLGNVEFDLPLKRAIETLNVRSPGANDVLLLKRGEFNDKEGSDKHDVFVTSMLNQDFLIGNPRIDAASRAFVSSTLAAQAVRTLSRDATLAQHLKAGRDFALRVDDESGDIAAVFISLHDATDKHIGYVMRLEKAPEIAHLNRVYLIYGGLGAFLLLVGSGAALLVLVSQARLLRMTRDLRDASAYNENILINVLDAIITIDELGKIVSFTPAAERMFGYTADEAIGQNVKLLMPEPYHSSHDGYLANYRESGRARIIGIGREVEAQRKDGGKFPVDLAVSEMVVANGRRFVGVIRDISVRKGMQGALVAAKEEAEAANQAKSQFLANMSHEIRTPMNAILGLTRQVLESEMRPEQREPLLKVVKSGRALVRIINDILDFSRLEAGQMKLERTPVRLEDLLLEVADLFSALVEEKGLEMFIDIAPNTPLVILGDGLRLTQVLNNLIGNAVKFTTHGEIHISARAIRFDEDTVALGFSVRDTGVGIAPDAIGNLFKSFSQADVSTTRKFGGSGLGLAIADRLVRLMGGHIEIESVPSEGTEVRFTLEAGMLMDEIRDVAASGRDLQQLSGNRVLVVDDQATSRMILLRLLHAWGVDTAEANSGTEALDLVRTAVRAGQPFDVILLDWRMPGMDGLEVARRIRELAVAESQAMPLRILMVTAHDTRGLQGAVGLHIDSILSKPVVPSHLFDAILSGHGGSMERQPLVASHCFAGLRVLLAEDNELNQEVAAGFMRRRGAMVVIAKDGAEAVELVKRQPFDVVLMDLHMPVMGGIEATERIHQLQQGKDIPIVAMTAAVMDEDRMRCAAAGMADFIAKPVEPEDLIRVLSAYAASPKHEGTPPSEIAPQTRPTAKAQPTAMPILDLAAGLRRLDGDVALQQKLLLGFIERWHDVMTRLNALLQAPLPSEAVDLIHTLKGIAANLGAAELADASRVLIEELRTAPLGEMRPASLALFESILDETVRQMQASIAMHARPAARGSEPTGDLLEALRTLEPCIAGQEVIDEELLNTLRRHADSDSPHAMRLVRLLQHLDNFDHVAALAMLNGLMRQTDAA